MANTTQTLNRAAFGNHRVVSLLMLLSPEDQRLKDPPLVILLASLTSNGNPQLRSMMFCLVPVKELTHQEGVMFVFAPIDMREHLERLDAASIRSTIAANSDDARRVLPLRTIRARQSSGVSRHVRPLIGCELLNITGKLSALSQFLPSQTAVHRPSAPSIRDRRMLTGWPPATASMR